jgi:Ca2+-binding EF-hand superfamily protein
MTEQTEEPQNLCSEQFRKVFNTFDKDGNGLITVKEFKKAMAGLGKKLSEKKV